MKLTLWGNGWGSEENVLHVYSFLSPHPIPFPVAIIWVCIDKGVVTDKDLDHLREKEGGFHRCCQPACLLP